MKLLIACCLLFSAMATAQPLKIKKNYSGIFSIGLRTTVSAFNDGQVGNVGLGIGGQSRVQISDQLNTDWYLDYITADVGDLAKREDLHIGWSVMFYPTKKFDARFRPYILAGHCFDYTRLEENRNPSNYLERWSSAVQGGAGVHFNLSQRLDLSLVAQYMVHLGTDIHVNQLEDHIEFHEEAGASLEGHLLFNVSINYKIADLW